MSKQQTRRQFTSEQKAAILKRHLVDKVGVSDVCDEYQLQPSQFYEWQRKLMENAAAALEEQIARLEAKLAKKDSVMVELLSEYVALKKELGEP
jgi:transposase-like protein